MSDLSVRPSDLCRTARSVASHYGDTGAVVISVGPEGVRIGAEGLSPIEVRQALCLAINYSFEAVAPD